MKGCVPVNDFCGLRIDAENWREDIWTSKIFAPITLLGHEGLDTAGKWQ